MKLNGSLMTKDTVVAEVKNGGFIPVHNEFLPLYLNRVHNIEQWLIDRAIDGHRTNARLLKKALRLTTAEDIELVLKVNAVTITDTYWFKPDGSNLCYEDVRFKENMFDKLALYGDPDSFNHEYANTPELTNTGSFEKCWKLIDGKWWMYKHGNENELFSELFVCEFGKALGFDMAHYELDGKYIKSPDFTNGAKVNYESAYSIVDTNEDYSLNFEAFRKISEKCAKEYLAMIFVDTLCFNMDRHTQNYGILRDVGTDEVLG